MSGNSIEAEIQNIIKHVLKKIVPTEAEREKTLKFSQEIVKKVEEKLKDKGIVAEVRIEGSIAKDTWLSGDKDIDIFIMVPKVYGREIFPRVLKAAKEAAGGNYVESYAEHPYLQARIEGFTVEFVPCFKIERSEEVISSVDRTPFHTAYVKKRLDANIRDEILLLKKFMHGIGAYGAEIKIGGFSGYLCELLILYYGSFIELLRAASKWRKGEVIDIESFYKGLHNEIRKIFPEPLIVIDPVDKGRNVASSVRVERLCEFIAASREFLKKPSIEYFFPPEKKPYTIEEVTSAINLRGTSIVFIKTGAARAVSDILWGQLYRTQRALRNLILQHDFKLVRDEVWSDEESAVVFLFELYSRVLPSIEKHIGPPLEKIRDCERFLEKYSGSQTVISGPRIDGDRWVVERRRKYNDVVHLLRDRLAGDHVKIGIGSLVSQSLSSSFEVLVNSEIKDFYLQNPGFAKFLTDYLHGKPRWLRADTTKNS
ncbi:MAG: CCA tRNA nucleotidyltransferase [Nitrososphaerota archaeon]|nr:CCA tRNA nucleotidyltransferase [Candidatus Bathyarchaeota archaeon]MDW8048533.1 CCA tRNA nucleotidyltransferase [Nitrososphaerota archaeon]